MNLTDRVEQLEQRLEALSSENRNAARAIRRWKTAASGLVALGVAGVVFWTGQAEAQNAGETVKMTFRVTDAQGKTVLEVSADEKGSPALKFLDGTGKPMAVLFPDKTGGNFALFDTKGNPAAGLTAGENGGTLALSNKAGEPAVVAFSDTEGGAVITYHKSGEGSGVMGTDASGGFFGLADAKGNDRIEMIAAPTGGSLKVLNAQGEAVFSRP